MQEIRIRWLLLGALFSSIGMSFIWPLTTIYLHNRLGTSLTEVGIILLFYSLANVVGSVLGGRLFDRLNPYHLTIAGVVHVPGHVWHAGRHAWLASLSNCVGLPGVCLRVDVNDGQFIGHDHS